MPGEPIEAKLQLNTEEAKSQYAAFVANLSGRPPVATAQLGDDPAMRYVEGARMGGANRAYVSGQRGKQRDESFMDRLADRERRAAEREVAAAERAAQRREQMLERQSSIQQRVMQQQEQAVHRSEGGGGGGIGGGRLNRDPLYRWVGPTFLAHAALRGAEEFTQYQRSMMLAQAIGSPMAMIQAEQQLQQQVGNIPIFGQVASLAVTPWADRTALAIQGMDEAKKDELAMVARQARSRGTIVEAEAMGRQAGLFGYRGVNRRKRAIEVEYLALEAQTGEEGERLYAAVGESGIDAREQNRRSLDYERFMKDRGIKLDARRQLDQERITEENRLAGIQARGVERQRGALRFRLEGRPGRAIEDEMLAQMETEEEAAGEVSRDYQDAVRARNAARMQVNVEEQAERARVQRGSQAVTEASLARDPLAVGRARRIEERRMARRMSQSGEEEAAALGRINAEEEVERKLHMREVGMRQAGMDVQLGVSAKLADAFGPLAMQRRMEARMLGISGGAQLSARRILENEGNTVEGRRAARTQLEIGMNQAKAERAELFEQFRVSQSHVNRVYLGEQGGANIAGMLKNIDETLKVLKDLVADLKD